MQSGTLRRDCTSIGVRRSESGRERLEGTEQGRLARTQEGRLERTQEGRLERTQEGRLERTQEGKLESRDTLYDYVMRAQ